jgi:hypothetical protein
MNPGGKRGGKSAAPGNGRLSGSTVTANPNALAAARRMDRAAGLEGRATRRLDAVNSERRASAWKVKPEGPDAASRWRRAAQSVTNGVDVRAASFLRGTARPGPKPGREAGYRAPASRLR